MPAQPIDSTPYLCWLLRTSVRTIGRLSEWDPSLVALALLNKCHCRAIERRHSCLLFPLVSGHLQAEWNLISHLHEPLSCTDALKAHSETCRERKRSQC